MTRTILLTAMLAAIAVATAASVWATEIARVNGKPLSDADVKMSISALNEAQQRNVLKDPNSRRDVLNNLVDQEVVFQEGERSKVDQEAEVQSAVLAFKRQLVANKVLERTLGPKINATTAKKYFTQHKREYSTDQVHVLQILMPDEASALDMKKRAKNPNEDFQALAEKFSHDPSAKNNRGDLGFIDHGSPLVKPFKDAAFSGSEGDIVGPVRTIYGYHVLKIIQKKIGKPLEFSEVESAVRNDLKQELIVEHVAGLKKKSRISVNEKALSGL